MATITDTALGLGTRIGRHFAIVSAIPSALYVLFVYLLVVSGAWSGAPNWTAALETLGDISVREASLLAIAALTMALVLHPLQFPLTQLLEGYWGSSRLARHFAVTRIVHHRRRRVALQKARFESVKAIEVASESGESVDGRRGDVHLRHVVDELEYRRALNGYPERLRRFMPTKFGNVLRRYEDLAGRQYGLKALVVAPHVALVAPPTEAAYLSATREQLDAAVRICVLAALATLTAVLFLLTAGWWLLLALMPYGVAWIAYHGAVASAHEYGAALSTIISLNRFAVYERHGIEHPTDTNAERTANEQLMELLGHRGDVLLRYQVADPKS